jgi:DNA/RNA-binding domain of Phe-tRNA-synthetase-like protein
VNTELITVDPHPLLDAACFYTRFPGPLGDTPSPPGLLALFGPRAEAPLAPDDEVKTAVRALLRHGGFRPAGRAKPASEYLRKALEEGWLGPDRGINLAVDACNAVSLHSGLPISVLDTERLAPPLHLRVGAPGEAYAFNPAGQVIEVAGLLVLCDAEGPCGSPVKDSQRTKTHEATTHTLSIVWGTRALPERTAAVEAWYRQLLEGLGAATTPAPR